jgi:hypothetical protein
MVLEYFKGDIFDRYSILSLKKERLPENENINGEFLIIETEYKKIMKDNIKKYCTLFAYARSLYEINKKIWDLESDIRKGLEGTISMEEVGKRAIAIRDFNRERVIIKNKINKSFNEFGDVKIDHASELELDEKSIDNLINIKDDINIQLLSEKRYSEKQKEFLKNKLKNKINGDLY